MYAVETFMRQVEALMSGRKVVVTEVAKTIQDTAVPCPACPPEMPRDQSCRATGDRRAIKTASAA